MVRELKQVNTKVQIAIGAKAEEMLSLLQDAVKTEHILANREILNHFILKTKDILSSIENYELTINEIAEAKQLMLLLSQIEFK